MWGFYHNSIKYNNVMNLNVDSKRNDYDSFSCTMIAPKLTVKNLLGTGGHVFPRDWVLIRDIDGTEIFSGFLEAVEEDELNLQLKGRDFKVLLRDESCGRNLRYTDMAGKDIIEDIMTYYTKNSYTLVMDFNETLEGTVKFSNDSLLTCISEVCDAANKDFWVVMNPNGRFDLHVGTRGNQTGLIYKAGRDIKMTNADLKGRDIVNRMMVFGSGDGSAQIRCCVPYKDIDDPDSTVCAGFDGYNSKCRHTAASASQALHGIREGDPYVDTSIVELSAAIAKAKVLLDQARASKVNIDFTKYVPTLGIGDVITVIDDKKKLTYTDSIVEINRDVSNRKMSVNFYKTTENVSSDLSNSTSSSDRNTRMTDESSVAQVGRVTSVGDTTCEVELESGETVTVRIVDAVVD